MLRVETAAGQPIDNTLVDIIVEAFVWGYRADSKSKSKAVSDTKEEECKGNITFRLRYSLDLRKKYRLSYGPVAEPYRELKNDILNNGLMIRANEYFLPIMSEDDYDRIAQEMLKKYYSEAIHQPTVISGRKLADAMGLTIRPVRMAVGSKIMGQFYFDDGEADLLTKEGIPFPEDISPDTILVNMNECMTEQDINNTIIHECVHKYKDLPFFLLQCMAGRDYCCHVNKKKISRTAPPKTEIDWMEMQAEKLPAHIRMEKGMALQVIKETLSKTDGTRSPENLNKVMQALSDTFRVTKMMAKIRMKELGYEEAEGIYNFIDHQYIPDHSCSGLWPKDVTFTVSPNDIRRAVCESPEFDEEIVRNKYTYVEGHLCLSDKKYVERTRNMAIRLSAYARSHIDECCLGFSIFGRSGHSTYEYGVAAKLKENKTGLYGSITLSSKPDTPEREKENEMAVREATLWADLALRLPNDFKKALDIIRVAKGVSVDTLSVRLGITKTYYLRMLKSRISLPHLVGICVVLGIRPDISLKLVAISGNHLTYQGADSLYMQMLLEPTKYDLQRCNEVLEKAGYDSLFPRGRNGEDDIAV